MFVELGLIAIAVTLAAIIILKRSRSSRAPETAERLLTRTRELLALRPELELISAIVARHGAIELECMHAHAGSVRTYRFEVRGNDLWTQVPSSSDIDLMRRRAVRQKVIDKAFFESRQFASGIPLAYGEWGRVAQTVSARSHRTQQMAHLALN